MAGVQFLSSFFLFVPVKNARIVQFFVSPVFVETQKKTAWKLQYQEIIRKKHGKKPSGKKHRGVLKLMIFGLGFKNPSKTR